MATTSRRLMAKAKGRQVSKGGSLAPKSHTPGKAKGATCQADWKKKYYMSSPKAYKDKQYSTYHNLAIKLNYGGKG